MIAGLVLGLAGDGGSNGTEDRGKGGDDRDDDQKHNLSER